MHTCIKSTELNDLYNGMKYYLLLCLGWPDAARITKYRSQNHMILAIDLFTDTSLDVTARCIMGRIAFFYFHFR